jgi:hypothetical protein
MKPGHRGYLMPAEYEYSHSFAAFDDQGNSYTLAVNVGKIDVSDLEMPGTPSRDGYSEIRDENGQGVNRIGKGQYHLPNGTIVHSTDHNAP